MAITLWSPSETAANVLPASPARVVYGLRITPIHSNVKHRRGGCLREPIENAPDQERERRDHEDDREKGEPQQHALPRSPTSSPMMYPIDLPSWRMLEDSDMKS